jgi:hypothetical protein
MIAMRMRRGVIVLGLCGLVLGGCSGPSAQATAQQDGPRPVGGAGDNDDREASSSIFDLFENVDDPNVTLEVNKYLWVASQEVLSFMPIEKADPFSGVIVMGYGTPPGGRQAYRATVFIQDPALDARALNVSLQTRSGPAAPDTVRAVEDAILTRARQIRIRDGGL